MYSVKGEPGLPPVRTSARDTPTEVTRVQSRSLLVGSSLAAKYCWRSFLGWVHAQAAMVSPRSSLQAFRNRALVSFRGSRRDARQRSAWTRDL